jgi:hypothetical protein
MTSEQRTNEWRYHLLDVAVITALAGAFLAVRCSASESTGTGSQSELYIVNRTPPSVSIIDGQHWRTVESIALDEDYEPDWGAVSLGGRFLYVAGDRKIPSYRSESLDPARLWIVDLSSRNLTGTIPIDSQRGPTFSKNGGYLVVQDSLNYIFLDTHTGEVAGKLPQYAANRGLSVSRNTSRVFSLYSNFPLANQTDADGPRSGLPAFLRIYGLDSEKPYIEIELPGSRDWSGGVCCRLMLSNDENWLYIVNGGRAGDAKNYRNGIVHVIDTAIGKPVAQFAIPAACGEVQEPEAGSPLVLTVSAKDSRGKLYRFHADRPPQVIDVGADPIELKRLPNQAGFWAISRQDVRFLADGASAVSYAVPLKPYKNLSQADATVFLDDYPSEILYLPSQNRLVIGRMTKSDKLAIANLTSNLIEHVVTVGRSETKARNVAEDVAGIAFAGSYGLDRGWLEVAAPQGNAIYAFHAPTADVTVIRADDGAILEKIAVEGVAMGATPNGRLVYTYGPRGITWIDTQTNKKLRDYHPDSSKVRSMQALENGQGIVTLTTKSLLVWDGTSGSLVAKVENLHDPSFIVQYSSPGSVTAVGKSRPHENFNFRCRRN